LAKHHLSQSLGPAIQVLASVARGKQRWQRYWLRVKLRQDLPSLLRRLASFWETQAAELSILRRLLILRQPVILRRLVLLRRLMILRQGRLRGRELEQEAPLASALPIQYRMRGQRVASQASAAAGR